MAWRIELSEKARDFISALDRPQQKRFDKFFARLTECDNPRLLGKALNGPLDMFWSYRVGDYRLICDICDNILTVEVIRIGHRREVYRT